MNDTNHLISRPPTSFERTADWSFRRLTHALALLAIGVVILLVVQIAITAYPAMQNYGVEFLTGDVWDPGAKKFGIQPQIGGTLYSSILGVAIGTLFGLAVAIFLTQDFIGPRLEIGLKNIVELLAAIPSVVYGLWGIFVVIPLVRPISNTLHESMGGIGIFGTRLLGPGLLPAALVLAIMVLPTVTAISRDAIASVPPKLREAAFGLGATRWEVIFGVILPTASRGIYGSIILAFGRAVGETMALAMLLGNSNTFSWSLFAPGNTLAALLANQWPESSDLEKGALMYAGLVLLGITLLINIIGTLILQRTTSFGDQRR
ncbi:MAG TPA: phosphate ABC transporter permease subunit PstC [Gemmataceae bacterium]|nr:phosphate ABC transporter permease subunit PstC [Gemmataceae bacterium]